jgi:ORF6N domain
MPKKFESSVSVEQIDGMIRTIRGVRVILDRDLAQIYGVPTFRFNEAIKRNRHRFPEDFMFQLTREEFNSLTSQFAISKPGNSSQFAMRLKRQTGTSNTGRAVVGALLRMHLPSTAHCRRRMFFAARAQCR